MTLTLVRRDRSTIGNSLEITQETYEALRDLCAIKGEWIHENARYRLLGVRRTPDGLTVEVMAEFLGWIAQDYDD